MPLTIVRNDITKMSCDAIVNAANNSLLGGGGVDGAIHRAAGPKLLEECRSLKGCETGKAKLTSGYNLACKYIIHTVGPIWYGGNRGEKELLISCYRESLRLAFENGCESVAFPLISSGAYRYPKQEAFEVAVSVISAFLEEHDMTVFMVIFDRASTVITQELYNTIESFIEARYVPLQHMLSAHSEALSYKRASEKKFECKPAMPRACVEDSLRTAPLDSALKERLATPDESFSEMLLRLIDERGLKDSECYKKANVDRKHFSKIRSDSHYRPSKQTVLAFAIALELNHRETVILLQSAGFAFSRSSKFDIIVEYFIEHGIYDIYTINQSLFSFDQVTLGA